MIKNEPAPMARESILLRLLEEGGPLFDHISVRKLRQSAYWPMLRGALASLNRRALYRSPWHGEGHIERVMLFGALLAMENGLGADEAGMLLNVCSYHDVGRLDDGVDDLHGRRAALRLGMLVSADDGSLRAMRAVAEAHSAPDHQMDRIILKHDPPDYGSCWRLARLFKDCDGLDRVRLGDLDVRYLRCPGSAGYADFALELYDAYAACEWAR